MWSFDNFVGLFRQDWGDSLMMTAEIVAYYAARRVEDNKPCARCGGDRLRADFQNIDRCHVPREDDRQDR